MRQKHLTVFWLNYINMCELALEGDNYMSNKVTIKQVEIYTRKKIYDLIAQSQRNTGLLAQLRHGIGKEPGDVPQLWGFFLDSMPEDFYGNDGPSRAEWAVYISLTLFALHQQGKDISHNLMYKDGQSLGTAIASLVHNDNDLERVLRRFNTVATANSIEELSYHLRGIIQLLRTEGIGLDYSKLAGDIYSFQFIELAPRVRLKWGQDFYRKPEQKTSDEQGKKED